MSAILVHRTPEEIGNSGYEYSKESDDFINALLEGGCPSLRSGFGYSCTTTQSNIRIASLEIGMPHRRHKYWNEILSRRSVSVVNYILRKNLNSSPHSSFCTKEKIQDYIFFVGNCYQLQDLLINIVRNHNSTHEIETQYVRNEDCIPRNIHALL
jgi:hypothetical protein